MDRTLCMTRKALLNRLQFLILLILFPISSRAWTAGDANTAFSAFNSVFYYQSGTNGWFKNNQSGGVSYFWTQAEEIECVIDAYEWSSNATYQAQITNLLNGFIANNGTVWTSYTPYNDDVMWAVLAFARGGVDTGKTNYCNLAKANFDACYARAYDTNLGGGLYWLYPNNASKNAAVNGPAAIAAYLLYQIYNDTNYLAKSTNIYAWERAVLFNTNNGVIADNIGTNGVVYGGATTYNQGTFLGAANFLGLTNDAELAANQAMASMTTSEILPQYGIANNNSGFNAIFFRWLTRFMKSRNLQNFYEAWLQTNAVAAWNVRRPWDNLSWCQWLQPTPASTNFYSWDCISSFEILQAADPAQGSAAQAVPANPAGYWPLDAATAVDATGSGNNGLVNSATWSSSGRINGCFTFNGSTSSIQITNPVCNDFTIAFWVKTTQTAGTGQWYNGAGLVDGDFSGVANDFGTALVGGKFAFGIGNPDATIFSTSLINDGNWHYCVAARQQATGIFSLYVDGNLQATAIGNRNTLNASSRLLFGAISSGGGYFNGSLDEVRIFSRCLSSNEVTALYSNLIVPPAQPPANLTATAGNAQIRLNWPEAPLATSYNVKRSLVTGGSYVVITNVATTSFTDTNVASNRTYYYVVSPIDAAGEGSNSVEAEASPLALVAWFHADAITNLSNGSAVSEWPDSSGNSYNAIQALGTHQPSFVSSAINGLPVVRFNSANSSYLWFYRPVQDDFTMILVYRSSQNNQGTGTAFYQGAGLVNGDQPGTQGDFGTALNANGQVLAGTGNPDTSIASGTGFNNGSPHLVTFKRTKSTGALALYVDGALVATGAGNTQSLTAPPTLDLGAVPSGGGFLSGDIAEVQIYNSALSDTDRLALEKALKCKYGLSGGGTPSAPTALTLAAGNRQIALDWVGVTGATGYNIWRSTNYGASYQMVATTPTSSYVDTSAANGQTNYYKVTALDACGAGLYSTAAGVLLPLPVLTLSAGANSLAITWPGWASDWQVYVATNLTPPIRWWPTTNAVGSNNGVFNISAPIGPGSQYFRLASP